MARPIFVGPNAALRAEGPDAYQPGAKRGTSVAPGLNIKSAEGQRPGYSSAQAKQSVGQGVAGMSRGP
jgi:hypothetical protein